MSLYATPFRISSIERPMKIIKILMFIFSILLTIVFGVAYYWDKFLNFIVAIFIQKPPVQIDTELSDPEVCDECGDPIHHSYHTGENGEFIHTASCHGCGNLITFS